MNESTVMTRLKEGTWDLHSRAENRAFQKRMVRGEIDRDEYAAWLGQMFLVHATLDGFVRPRLGVDPSFGAVDEDQLQSARLERDLAAVGVDPGAVEPMPATRALCEGIARAAAVEPLRLLGYHYVLEGSTNGNSFIARKLRETLPLGPERGFEYLDPYGEEQRERWAAFKRAMTAQSWEPAQIETLVAAAREMFEAISDLSLELQSLGARVRV